jgi:hypothetical protein
LRIAREVAAGQHRDIVLSQQGACEVGVAHAQRGRHTGPQVKPGIGQLHVHHRCEQGGDLGEFGTVESTVFHHVLFVVPGSHAGGLHGRPHGTAMVGAVEQEGLDELRIARHKAAAQPRHVAALGQAGEGQQVAEVRAAQSGCGLQATQRGFVAEVYFAVALVGANHKAVPVCQGEQFFPLGQRHHRTRGIAW